LALIAKLPDNDIPGMFSLPDNIERSVQRATSSQVIVSLKALSVSAAAASSFDKEKWREKLEPLLDMWAKLTSAGDSVLDPHSALVAAKADLASKQPVEQFVIMENAMAAGLVAKVNGDLQELKGVLFGTGLLTPSVQDLGAKLMAESVPSAWSKQWEGPEDPKKWLRSVVAKRIALTSWTAKASGLFLHTLGNRVRSFARMMWFHRLQHRCCLNGCSCLSCSVLKPS
jgi:Dynein heavy chain C-terminal domain